jgi:hypothetical protein
MKYDDPFEILQKLGPATHHWLRMPASYDMHPMLNIAHLEAYASSDPQFGVQSIRRLNWEDFKMIPEFEVEYILKERWKKGQNSKHIQELLTRFVGFDSSYDEWLTRRHLKNAPDVLKTWNSCSKTWA